MATPTKKSPPGARTFRIAIREDLCKGCELCVSFCPKGCLAMPPARINARGVQFAECVRPGDCVGWRSCVTVCPAAAIELFEIIDEEEDNG